MIKKISNSVYRDEIVYVIAGKGSLKAQILNLAKDLKVNLRLVGYLDEANLVRFHFISYCFVLSSLNDASPLSVIEALWLSKPILLSKFVGNAPETLVENKNGFLIDMTNDNAAQIDRLLSLDNTEYQEFCSESFRIAKANFDSNLVTKKFIEDLMNFNKGVIDE
jgi:glycosyltransferase involved in cell wall biosynthesis